MHFQLAAILERKNKLTDAFLDSALEREDYEEGKTALHMERAGIEEKLSFVDSGTSLSMQEVDRYVALAKDASLLTNLMSISEMRDWMQEAMSHRSATGKSVVFVLQKPLAEVSLRPGGPIGRPSKDTSRNFWQHWIRRFAEQF